MEDKNGAQPEFVVTYKQVGEVLMDVFTLFNWSLVGKIKKQFLKIV